MSELEIVDDIWIRAFLLLDIADFLSINLTCKHFNILTNITRRAAQCEELSILQVPINQYWKYQSKRLCRNVEDNIKLFTTQDWYAFYKQLFLFITDTYKLFRMAGRSLPFYKHSDDFYKRKYCIPIQIVNTYTHNHNNSNNSNNNGPVHICCAGYHNHQYLIDVNLDDNNNHDDDNNKWDASRILQYICGRDDALIFQLLTCNMIATDPNYLNKEMITKRNPCMRLRNFRRLSSPHGLKITCT